MQLQAPILATTHTHLCQVKLAAGDVDVCQGQPGALKLIGVLRHIRQLGHTLREARGGTQENQ